MIGSMPTPRAPDWKGDSDLRSLFLGWWDSLEGRRGDRHELERARRLDDVFRSAGFYRLKAILEKGGPWAVYDRPLAMVAGVASVIRADLDHGTFGALLSSLGVGFNEVRRLDRLQDDDRLYRTFRGLVVRAGRRAPITQVADTLYWWRPRSPNREFFYDFFRHEEAEVP